MQARKTAGVRRYSADRPRPKSRSPCRNMAASPGSRRSGRPEARSCDGSRSLRPPLPPDRACSNPCAANRRHKRPSPPRPVRSACRTPPAIRKFLRALASVTASQRFRLLLDLGLGSIMRISDIGIMGSKRINRKNRNVNSPSVPTKVSSPSASPYRFPRTTAGSRESGWSR